MQNGRSQSDNLAQAESWQAALARLRLELSGWREELLALLSDGNARGRVNWQAVEQTRRRIDETVRQIRRLQAGRYPASQSN